MQDGSRGIFVYTWGHQASREPVNAYGKAPWRYSRTIFGAVKWRGRRRLNADTDSLSGVKQDARQRGVRGETFAYWYLRRHGYVFVARNYVPREIEGEIDQIGYDAETLVFVEVRTRTAREDQSALSEVSVTAEKQHLLGRTARRFLMERHVKECPVRFDVVAIEEFSGQAKVVRLHKNAFKPRM